MSKEDSALGCLANAENPSCALSHRLHTHQGLHFSAPAVGSQESQYFPNFPHPIPMEELKYLHKVFAPS